MFRKTTPFSSGKIFLLSHSPDLNPSDNVWDMVSRRLFTVLRTLAQLILKVQIIWNELPQEDIDRPIL